MFRIRLATWACGVLCAWSVAGPLCACLWDTDTLPMERTRFPTALELITGKFLRHSDEFYDWRIADRQKKLAANPQQIALYDDLAVAYNKRGQHQKAIETILAKEKLQPGLYETYANLGAFYIYTGELEKSRDAIAKAIEINPNAHFGREVYQKHLVEYVLTCRVNGKVKLPLSQEDRKPWQQNGFAAHLQKALAIEYSDAGDARWREEHEKAVHGVLGMLRFADHRHPVLLEALGDLLLTHGAKGNACQLAARAYLMASYSVQPQSAKAEANYRKHAKDALQMHEGLKLEQVEAAMAAELTAGNAWFDKVRQQELAWIAAGKDADGEFSQEYYTDPAAALSSGAPPVSLLTMGGTLLGVLTAAVAVTLLLRRLAQPAKAG